MKTVLFVMAFMSAIFLVSCDSDDKTDKGIVKDIDGNIYQTVTIGSQNWMTENLKTTRFRNGDSVTYVTGNAAWNNLNTGGYCLYDNQLSHKDSYGYLYNWAAVNDNRKLAPEGWHIASDAEWDTLVHYLGGDVVAGGKLKDTGTVHWTNPNTDATNETGFSALPGGYRISNGSYEHLKNYGYWWSSTPADTANAWTRNTSYNYGSISRDAIDKKYGFSVRCVKDN